MSKHSLVLICNNPWLRSHLYEGKGGALFEETDDTCSLWALLDLEIKFFSVSGEFVKAWSNSTIFNHTRDFPVKRINYSLSRAEAVLVCGLEDSGQDNEP